MGGKRPDQHNIDPAEAGASDYKNLPQTGKGGSNLDDTVERDREKLSREQQEAKGQPFPPNVPNPSVHTRHGRKQEEADEELDEEPGAAETDSSKGNPLV